MSLPERFVKVEEGVKAITASQDAFKPLTPLLSSVDNLLKAEQLVTSFRKKLTDLIAATEESKATTQALKAKVTTMVESADQTLAELITKRQKEVRHLEAKAGNVENLYQQLKHEAQIAAKQLQVLLKEEAIEIATSFDHRLAEEKNALLQRLERLKSSQAEAVTAAREEAKRTIQELADYGRDNSDKISILKSSTPVSQSSRLSSEDAKNMILTEVTGRIMKGMQTLKDQMDAKCGAVSVKYSEDLMRLRGEVETARDAILGQRQETPSTEAGPVAKLAKINRDVRRLLNHVGAFCTRGLQGISHLTKSTKRSMTLITPDSGSDQSQALIREMKSQYELCSQQLSDISTKLKADFFSIQEAVNEGKVVVTLKNVKLPADKKPAFEVQKDLRGRLEKEFLATRDRVEHLLTETQEELKSLNTTQGWSQLFSGMESPMQGSDDAFDDT